MSGAILRGLLAGCVILTAITLRPATEVLAGGRAPHAADVAPAPAFAPPAGTAAGEQSGPLARAGGRRAGEAVDEERTEPARAPIEGAAGL